MKNIYSLPAFDTSKNIFLFGDLDSLDTSFEKEKEKEEDKTFSPEEKQKLEKLLENHNREYTAKESIKNKDGSTTEKNVFVKPGEMAGESTTTTQKPGTYHQKSEILTTGLAKNEEEENKKWENISKTGMLPVMDESVSSNPRQLSGLNAFLNSMINTAKVNNDWTAWNKLVRKTGNVYQEMRNGKDVNKKALDTWIDKNLKEYNPK